MELSNNDIKVVKDTEFGYIKIMKSETAKGAIYYAWDIKVLEGKDAESYKKMVEIVEELNKEMQTRFTALNGT
jgi:hypothetical protein